MQPASFPKEPRPGTQYGPAGWPAGEQECLSQPCFETQPLLHRPAWGCHSPATGLRFRPCMKAQQGQVPNSVAHRRPLAASGPVSKDPADPSPGPGFMSRIPCLSSAFQ